MYYRVANNLKVTSANPEFTQAVPMNGDNAVFAEVAVLTTGTVRVEIQIGNDLETWFDSGVAGVSIVGPDVQPIKVPSAGTTLIQARYMRLKLTLTTGTTALIAAGVNTAKL